DRRGWSSGGWHGLSQGASARMAVPGTGFRERRWLERAGRPLRSYSSPFTNFPTWVTLVACAGCAFSSFSAHDRDGMKDCLPTGLLAESLTGFIPSAHPRRDGIDPTRQRRDAESCCAAGGEGALPRNGACIVGVASGGRPHGCAGRVFCAGGHLD